MILHLTLCIVNVRYKFALMGWGGGDCHIRLSGFPFFGVACFFELYVYVSEHTSCLYKH